MEVIFQQIDDDELKRKMQAAATGKPSDAANFFAQFDFNIYLNNKQYLIVYDKLVLLLKKLEHLDSSSYVKMHKGVPFYFAAISSFVLHNFIQAVYFFDAAVSEDIKNDKGSRTPAIMFLELDGDPENQAARELTQITENKLISFIDDYNLLPAANKISIPDFRTNFLSRAVNDKNEWRTLATSLITFLLEWDYLAVLQQIRASDGTQEPFYNHLFHGCVLFESLLKSNPKVPVPENQLGMILNGNTGIRKSLGINRNLNTSGPSFADVLASLPKNVNNIEMDIELSARLRNTIGHNIGWPISMTLDEYVLFVTKLSNSIIHSIACLY